MAIMFQFLPCLYRFTTYWGTYRDIIRIKRCEIFFDPNPLSLRERITKQFHMSLSNKEREKNLHVHPLPIEMYQTLGKTIISGF